MSTQSQYMLGNTPYTLPSRTARTARNAGLGDDNRWARLEGIFNAATPQAPSAGLTEIAPPAVVPEEEVIAPPQASFYDVMMNGSVNGSNNWTGMQDLMSNWSREGNAAAMGTGGDGFAELFQSMIKKG